MKHYTKDYQLSDDELSDKYDYEGDGGQHPGYPVYNWIQAVKCKVTRLSYWSWVEFNLTVERETAGGDCALRSVRPVFHGLDRVGFPSSVERDTDVTYSVEA